METRKIHETKFSELPADYLKMVKDVFTTNFNAGLKRLDEFTSTQHYFDTAGRIYKDEIILDISLMEKGQLAATSVHASTDFDAQASTPTLQDLLSACVDAAGAIFASLFASTSDEAIKKLAEQSLSAFENVPFQWTALQVERHSVFVKLDKTNPHLDQMADEWLAENDPDHQEALRREQAETENLFVTGAKTKGKAPLKH